MRRLGKSGAVRLDRAHHGTWRSSNGTSTFTNRIITRRTSAAATTRGIRASEASNASRAGSAYRGPSLSPRHRHRHVEERARRSRPVDDVPDAAVLAAALRDTRDVTAATAAAAGEEREREVLTLDGRMRACALLLVALAAVGYGRASYGVVPGEVMAICALGADVLCVLHLVLAVYAAALSVTRLKRSPTLWAVKTLLGGVAAVHELRRLGATDSSTTCTE
eukprot:IDg15147t1